MAVVGSREFLKSKQWESKSAVTFAQRLSLFHPLFFFIFSDVVRLFDALPPLFRTLSRTNILYHRYNRLKPAIHYYRGQKGTLFNSTFGCFHFFSCIYYYTQIEKKNEKTLLGPSSFFFPFTQTRQTRARARGPSAPLSRPPPPRPPPSRTCPPRTPLRRLTLRSSSTGGGTSGRRARGTAPRPSPTARRTACTSTSD